MGRPTHKNIAEDRKTFSVPIGYRAVRDEDGRATGDVEVDPDYYGDAFSVGLPNDEPSIDMAGLDAAIQENIDKPFVVRELEGKARIYAERNRLYGDNYKRFGPIMALMMAGQTIDCNDAHVMSRLGILVQVIAKATRYGENFTRGGHDDSLDDIAVYAMMLKELDNQ